MYKTIKLNLGTLIPFAKDEIIIPGNTINRENN